MKRFIIPAFFVIDVDETKPEEMTKPHWDRIIANSAEFAEALAAEMQADANHRAHNQVRQHLMLDETLPTVEIPYEPAENELPHTIKPYYFINFH